MKKYTKIGAVILAVVMLLALSVTAFATVTLTDGEAGGFDPGNTDKPHITDKIVTIKKDIKAFKDPSFLLSKSGGFDVYGGEN